MESDCYFRIGSTHTVCQDYTVAGEQDGISYAFLADGCSGAPPKREPGAPPLIRPPGFPYTDFGSRFVVQAARQYLKEMSIGVFPIEKVITFADGAIRLLRLPSGALDATFLAVVQQPDRCVRCFVAGDGVRAVRDRQGCIHYTSLKYGNNMPYYLSYDLSRSRRDEYLIQAKTVEVNKRTFTPGEGWGELWTREYNIAEYTHQATDVVSADQYDLSLVMSDGAESFQLKDGTPIALEQVLEQVFAFKNYVGPFIQRRMNAFLTRFCVEQGWKHTDDFSVAGIYLGDAPVQDQR